MFLALHGRGGDIRKLGKPHTRALRYLFEGALTNSEMSTSFEVCKRFARSFKTFPLDYPIPAPRAALPMHVCMEFRHPVSL